MAKNSTQYVCQQCGFASPKWAGQCPNCSSWNSLVETVVSGKKSHKSSVVVRGVKLSEVAQEVYTSRITTNIGELDRVLGGGIVPGMVTLIAGEPGIGKSTLLLQIADGINNGVGKNKTPIVYVAGEESVGQIANRANRLKINNTQILVIEETDIDIVIGSIPKNARLVIVDSIQTMTTGDLAGTAGSVGQVRECALRITGWAKKNSIPVFIVGHVTREGTIAGPRVLEHMVDTVLWFEGERQEFLRVVRAIKNRFGATDEVGIFSMEETGLREVKNPSEMFLGKNLAVSGSAVGVVMEGSRPMLVEIQALVAPTKLAFPKRSASGVDSRRLEMLIAVLTRRAGLPLWEYDIFVNIAGGLKVNDPALDLAICISIASAFRDKALPEGFAAIGEVGLLGEVRDVMSRERREKEARRLGFKKVLSNKVVNTVNLAISKYVSSK